MQGCRIKGTPFTQRISHKNHLFREYLFLVIRRRARYQRFNFFVVEMTAAAFSAAGANGATNSVNGVAESTTSPSMLDVKILGYETHGR